MLLEEQLFDFATGELAKAKAAVDTFNRLKAADPDEWEARDGNIVNYNLRHWNEVCSLISKKYCIEGSFGVAPIDSARLAGTLSYWISKASMEAEYLAVELDAAQSQAESEAIEHRLQSQRASLAKSKQMANFYAFILGINHPFPGVDMLPEDISAAA